MRDLLLAIVEQNKRLTDQVTTLATRVTQLEEQKGRSSRNSSKPPTSDGPGQRGFGGAGSGGAMGDGQRRKRGGQQGHPGHGRDLLPSERCEEVIDHHPDQCGQCGSSLSGANEGAEPWRHQIVDIPSMTPIVVEHPYTSWSAPAATPSPAPCCPPMWRAAAMALVSRPWWERWAARITSRTARSSDCWMRRLEYGSAPAPMASGRLRPQRHSLPAQREPGGTGGGGRRDPPREGGAHR